MDVRTESDRLLGAEGEDESLSGFMLEHDAYLRLVYTPCDIASETGFTGVTLYRSKQTRL